MNIKVGDIVKSTKWNEPVEISLLTEFGEYVRITGATIHSRQHIDQVIPSSEIQEINVNGLRFGFTASARYVFLSIEALRYRYASLYDVIFAVNVSKVDPLPHQIEAVYGQVLQLPRIRFLIADDPGAGKTIMAGLVIKELKLRGLIRRILIVAPGHLKDQWRRELKERFEEHFAIVDRNAMRSHFGENVWEREYQVITSLDFARQEDVMNALAAVHWDLIVVDEAHKMAAYRYGNKIEKTKRYRLGELLSKNGSHLLFLTATPHRGDPENFRLFLDLLQPGAFATTEMLEASIRAGDNPLFIRRLKEDLKDFQGRPLFLPRQVKTLTFDLGRESPDEKELYNALSKYVEEQYNRALASDKRRNITFALVILQRRLASSMYALYRSLERRKKRLEEMLQQADAFLQGARQNSWEYGLSLEDVEEMSEEDRWEQEALWETLSMAENRAELEHEIQTLAELLQQARNIVLRGEEVKLRHFKEALNQLEAQEPGEKILLFTESRDTLVYLEKRMREWGYSVCTIHGGMSLEARIEAEHTFKNEAQVMIATEAAGEGINLQFCHLMINYDLPWNPNRLEQRMGRIHRYGQTHEVTIFNLVASDTREGQVMARLFNKLEEIRKALGSDKVFDVIDEIFPGRNLAQLLIEAAANARTVDDILQEIEIYVDADYIASVKASLGESLATRYIDYTRIKEMADRAREHRLIPEYTQAFFQKAWDRLGGVMRQRKDTSQGTLYTIERVPRAIRQITEVYDFQRRFGTILSRYPLVTFAKEVAMRHPDAEFVSFGHPLFEAVLTWAGRNALAHLRQGTVFTDPDGQRDGVLLFFEGEISDGLGQIAGKRLFALFVPRDGTSVQPVNPAILWDLQEGGPVDANPPDLKALQSQGMAYLIPQLEAYRAELLQERLRQADIKRKYGVQSLNYLILKLDGELVDLQIRQERGENLDLVIRNKRQQKADYELALRKLRGTIQREQQLTMSTPNFFGAVQVVPLLQISEPVLPEEKMYSNAEVERVGMDMTMDYERRHGRQPEDVATENLGFDVRSSDPQSGEKRYIEVKARAGVGMVLLTRNEWFKAQRFGDDFYLYVVLNAITQPRLYIIQNPAQRLQPEKKTEVRYVVNANTIVSFGSTE